MVYFVLKVTLAAWLIVESAVGFTFTYTYMRLRWPEKILQYQYLCFYPCENAFRVKCKTRETSLFGGYRSHKTRNCVCWTQNSKSCQEKGEFQSIQTILLQQRNSKIQYHVLPLEAEQDCQICFIICRLNAFNKF